MKNLILISVLLSVIFSSSLFAKRISYFNGQKEYLKKCRSCHSSGSFFVKKYTMAYWKDALAENGEKLASKHANIQANVKEEREGIGAVQEYFKSKRYQKKLKYIRAFTQRFAKDGEKNHHNR